MKAYIVIDAWLDVESFNWCYSKAIVKIFLNKKSLDKFLKWKNQDRYYIIEKNIEK